MRTVPAAHMNRLFLSMAATIYVVVFVAFLVLERAGLGIGHFYYLAIALVALALGPAWGAAAGGIATGSTRSAWSSTTRCRRARSSRSRRRSASSTTSRSGALLGWFAAHYRAGNAELQILAQRDLVTGLPNTRAFELAIDRRLAAARPFALLVGDLDARPFDEDRDEALRRVSDTLSLRLDPEADVARIGGDEFAVLSLCDSVEHAAQPAVQLERSLCETGSFVTFGWSAYPREGENALKLYRAADERLHGRRVLRGPRLNVAPPVAV